MVNGSKMPRRLLFERVIEAAEADPISWGLFKRRDYNGPVTGRQRAEERATEPGALATTLNL